MFNERLFLLDNFIVSFSVFGSLKFKLGKYNLLGTTLNLVILLNFETAFFKLPSAKIKS